jgi:hypothetical protein
MELLSYKKKHLVNLSTLHGALGTDGRIPELQKIRVSVAIPHGGLRTMKQREYIPTRSFVSIPHGGLRTRNAMSDLELPSLFVSIPHGGLRTNELLSIYRTRWA